MWRAEVAAVAEGEAARTAETVGILGLLAVARGDHEAVLVVGDRQVPMHLLDLREREAGLRQDRLPVALSQLTLTEKDTHGEHALEGGHDRSLGAGGQQV